MNELEQQAALSGSEKGKVRLDYQDRGRKMTVLWEPVRDGMIETIFDDKGIVLVELFHRSKSSADEFAESFMKKEGIAGAKPESYSEVRIQKACPSCGEDKLVRIAESAEDSTKAPITPLYKCGNCGNKSYYLSDEYLDYLVVNNRAMFDEKELKELDSNKEKFIAELKEYIIRIFASQKIIRIK